MVRVSLMVYGIRPCWNKLKQCAAGTCFMSSAATSRRLLLPIQQRTYHKACISRSAGAQNSNLPFGSDQNVAPWIAAYTEAEKIVGPLTSLAGMKNLLGDELANVGIYAQRLLESGHPIIQRTRGLVFDVNSARQLRGLIILLLSQAMGASTTGPATPISLRQRSLAEITELIFAANVLHDGVMEINNQPAHLEKGLKFGNKIAILGGDFLLASACTALSRLQSAEVVMLISNVGWSWDYAYLLTYLDATLVNTKCSRNARKCASRTRLCLHMCMRQWIVQQACHDPPEQLYRFPQNYRKICLNTKHEHTPVFVGIVVRDVSCLGSWSCRLLHRLWKDHHSGQTHILEIQSLNISLTIDGCEQQHSQVDMLWHKAAVLPPYWATGVSV